VELGPKISLIGPSFSLSGEAVGLARDAARKDISRWEIPSADAADIAILWYSWPVALENRSCIGVTLHKGSRFKAAGHFQAKRNAADAGADFNNPKRLHSLAS
jgi:hypothetical protein